MSFLKDGAVRQERCDWGGCFVSVGRSGKTRRWGAADRRQSGKRSSQAKGQLGWRSEVGRDLGKIWEAETATEGESGRRGQPQSRG